MIKIKILIISFFVCFFIFLSNSSARTVKFDLSFNTNIIKVGKSIDLIIKAIDENGNIDKNFKGSVLFLEGDDTDQGEIIFSGFEDPSYPSYIFKKNDFGVIKIKNAIKFLTKGKKSIAVTLEDTSKSYEGAIGKIFFIVKKNDIFKKKLVLKIIPEKYIKKIIKALNKAEKKDGKIIQIKHKIYELMDYYLKTPEKYPKSIQILKDILSIMSFYQYITTE